MVQNRNRLVVDVAASGNEALLKSSVGCIRVVTNDTATASIGTASDYAVWYFLPIAMRLDMDLHICGRGSSTTALKARRISEIWQSWLPGHLSRVEVSFSEEVRRDEPASDRELVFLSGGLDAAHTALTRLASGRSQDVITIQGMDYPLGDDARFGALVARTAPLAELLSGRRIIVKSDAYSLYEKVELNLRRHHLGHIFALAGAGFVHAHGYNRLILAADERLDGQFLTFPWGSNSATNFLFDDGCTRLCSDSEDVARPEKIALVQSSEIALKSLSFCWNRQVQPQNCGICVKCLRTKLLFLAVTGGVPPIFSVDEIPKNWAERLRYKEPGGLHAVHEIFNEGLASGYWRRIPNFEDTRAEIRAYYARVKYRRWEKERGKQKGRRFSITEIIRSLRR